MSFLGQSVSLSPVTIITVSGVHDFGSLQLLIYFSLSATCFFVTLSGRGKENLYFFGNFHSLFILFTEIYK